VAWTGGAALYEAVLIPYIPGELFEIASSASISFCPGLKEALESPTPPDVDFFKSLVTDFVGRWGIYALVLKKQGAKTLIYIGSATNDLTGVRGRFYTYN